MEYKWKYDYSMEEKELALLAQHLYEENERLNNIINELEKELKQEYLIWQCGDRCIGKSIKYGIEVAREHYFKRLQELKGNNHGICNN